MISLTLIMKGLAAQCFKFHENRNKEGCERERERDEKKIHLREKQVATAQRLRHKEQQISKT